MDWIEACAEAFSSSETKAKVESEAEKRSQSNKFRGSLYNEGSYLGSMRCFVQRRVCFVELCGKFVEPYTVWICSLELRVVVVLEVWGSQCHVCKNVYDLPV